MDVNLIITRDYEKMMNSTFSENKAKQSQFSFPQSRVRYALVSAAVRRSSQPAPWLSRENIIRQIFAYLIDIILLNDFLAFGLELIHKGKNTGFHKK